MIVNVSFGTLLVLTWAMALALSLLFDDRTEAVVRGLWRRLEEAGIPTLLTHTHGRHVPHLTYASLRSYDLPAVTEALLALEDRGPLELYFDALGTFRRSRCWLAPAASADLVERQATVVRAAESTGAELHRHYRPGAWMPHLTLAPRLHLADLPCVAGFVYDVLPFTATADRLALIETSTGERHVLPRLV